MNKTKNGVVVTKEFTANYIKFGTGKKTLIMIPGVGDGLKTVKGLAVPFYMLYNDFCKDYTVYSFSRRNHIPKDFSIEDMAEDLYKCKPPMYAQISFSGNVAITSVIILSAPP